MKHLFIYFLFALLYNLSYRENVVAPVNLRCEYLADPLGVDESHPRFSWMLQIYVIKQFKRRIA